jgi:glycosyltransferase involved in cell wall biosynthesis
MSSVSLRPGIRVAYLTNILAPYWKPTLEHLASRYILRIFLSAPMELNRPWPVDWRNLDVVLQRTVTLRRRWRHPAGFSEAIYVHLPLNTISQLRQFDAQVVLSNEMGFRTLLACLYRNFARQSRLLVIAEMAESTERGRGPFRGILRRLLQSRVDAFLVPGRSGTRFLESLGVPSSRIVQTGYTTDVQKFCTVPLIRPPAIVPRLLYVGQLIERKGLLPFVSALAEWAVQNPDRTMEFVIVGDGPSRSRLENFRSPSNLRLLFRGNMTFSDLPSVYAECGIFCFPTLADSWGVVVNEAMVSGLPVLGSIYSQAVEELVEDGKNGWSFQPEKPASVSSAINRALNTSIEVLNTMRHCARSKAAQFTPESVAAQIGQAIQNVLGES